MGDWLKDNLWHIITTAGLLLVMGGQWTQRQDGSVSRNAERIAILDARVEGMTIHNSAERNRLDPVYASREVVLAQNQEILRRLDALEVQMRTLIQRTR